MPISRLRLQLAVSFALVFLAGLGAADLALFTWLRKGAEAEFTRRATSGAEGVSRSILAELAETKGALDPAAHEVLGEWPTDETGFIVSDGSGTIVAQRGIGDWGHVVPAPAHWPSTNRTWEVPLDDEGGLRLALARGHAGTNDPAYSVLAILPTAPLVEANERLALWLALSGPVVVLLAFIAAYMLARRALVPLRAMTEQITGIAPGDLDRRLPVRSPPDELDALAEQFNRLLERLKVAQARNQQFLAQAAHQLRTPLTVIRGESSLGLDRPRSQDEHREVLRRVSLAAEQMSHRVDDLLLLAEAEAGQQPPLTDEVELDGLVLDCVDLMRGRASALGRRLELTSVEEADLLGNEPLIREAVLELLENACRYGTAERPIQISAASTGSSAVVEVVSGGAPLASDTETDARTDRAGLGLSIVRWIAAAHGGRLTHYHEAGVNAFRLELSRTPGDTVAT